MDDGQEQTSQSSSIEGLERPATVFLSYAREDTEAVRDLQLRINVRGVRSWRDVNDLPLGSVFENEIVQAIEQEVDATALYITPDCLKSNFIWKTEVPAALRRQKRDPQFHIVPILQDVSFSELQQFCRNRNLTDLMQFNGISLTDGSSSLSPAEQTERRNEVARRLLEAALTFRLHHIKVDRNYEPEVRLLTFDSPPPSTKLDLDLDWRELIRGRERLSTPQEWEDVLLPALLDVAHVFISHTYSRRIHMHLQCILPVALALGFAFRAPSGLILLLERSQGRGTWSTDVQASEKEPLLSEFDYYDEGNAQVAVVEVAASRFIRHSVEDAFPFLGLTPGPHVRLMLPEPSIEAVRDAAHAQAIAQQIGYTCRNLCDKQRVALIHLFVTVPVELAVLIGYQLNAICPVTLYHWLERDRVYKPVGTIR